MLQLRRYQVEHAISMMKNIVIGEAQHSKASSRQVLVSRAVIGLRDVRAMGLPINLDHKLCMQAGEVDIIRPKLDLLAEMVAAGSKGPQDLPEGFLGNCGITAKLAAQIAAHSCTPEPVAVSRHEHRAAPPP
jgi:hypothetical protein